MDALFAVLWPVCGIALAVATLVGTVELLVLTVAGWRAPLRLEPLGGVDPRELRVVIVVPAHDEEAGITRTVHNLLTCAGARDKCEVVVVADNCGDRTAAVAAATGVRVLVRDDPDNRGKGHALDFAFCALLPEGFDVFVVVDADTVVDVGFVDAVRRVFAAGADAAQVRYMTADSRRSPRTRLMHIAFAGINVVRPRGRERLGLSAGIVGNGFALSRATLEAVPYEARSIVEDLEYHVRLVRRARRVRFVDDVTVHSEMPDGGRGARDQRARWEGGRIGVLRQNLPGLLRAVARGQFRLCEPAADLLLLPLAFHVLLLLGALLVPFWPAQVYAGCGLLVVGLHVVCAVRVAGGGFSDLMTLLTVPFYVLWKIGLASGIVRAAGRRAAWVRTMR